MNKKLKFYLFLILWFALLSFKGNNTNYLYNYIQPVEDKVPLKGVILGTLIDDAFKHLVPLPISTNEGEMTLVDVVYCGHSSQPELIAILIPKLQNPSNFTPSRIADCSKSLHILSNTGKSTYSNSNWVAAVKVDVVWIPWKLQLIVNDVAITGSTIPLNNEPSAAPLIQLKQNKKELYSISTSDIKLNVGSEEYFSYNVALSFRKDKINIYGIPSSPNINVALDTVGKSISINSRPELTNTIIALNDEHINKLANTYFKNEKIPIDLGSDQKDSLVMESINISCSNNNLSTSTILSRKGEIQKYNGETSWQGSDLALSNINLTPLLNDCGPKPSLSQLRQLRKWSECKANDLLLKNFADLVSSKLKSKFNGAKLRPVKPSSPVKIIINNKERECSIVALSAKSYNSNVLFHLNTIIK